MEQPAELERDAVLGSYPAHECIGQLDDIARLAAGVCATPIAAISLVGSDRQRFIGRHGIDLEGTPRAWSFCDHAMRGAGTMVVPDATQDSRFAHNPLVTAAPHVRFYAGHPLTSRSGMALGSLCVISPQARPKLNSEESDALRTLALAATAVLERARVEHHGAHEAQRSRFEADELVRRFEVLADAMPHLVWSSPADGMVDYLSRGWIDYTGEPAEASYGVGWASMLHDDDRAATDAAWQRAVATGSAYEIEYRLRRHDGQFRWMLARGAPVRNAAGEISRWIGTCTDVHTRREDAERLELMAGVLSHRIKNIFAIVGGLIALTTRRRPELDEVGRDLQRRVLALGRAHDFVGPHGEPACAQVARASLKGLLAALLAPYNGESEARIVVAGDDVEIDDRSATALALFFHELASNAAQHGALSTDDGHVAIFIVNGEEIVLRWEEHGGPRVSDTVTRGFGSSLIDMSIDRQLGGVIRTDWHEDGLRVEARVARASMRR